MSLYQSSLLTLALAFASVLVSMAAYIGQVRTVDSPAQTLYTISEPT